MTPDTDTTRNPDALDRVARGLYAQAVDQVPSRTRQQLRARRTIAKPARSSTRALGWSLATACAAVFAVAIGLRFVTPETVAPAVAPADTPIAAIDTATANEEYRDALASLEEDPDLYLWLASSDAQPLAME